jgi:hypothetical protein
MMKNDGKKRALDAYEKAMVDAAEVRRMAIEKAEADYEAVRVTFYNNIKVSRDRERLVTKEENNDVE